MEEASNKLREKVLNVLGRELGAEYEVKKSKKSTAKEEKFCSIIIVHKHCTYILESFNSEENPPLEKCLYCAKWDENHDKYKHNRYKIFDKEELFNILVDTNNDKKAQYIADEVIKYITAYQK